MDGFTDVGSGEEAGGEYAGQPQGGWRLLRGGITAVHNAPISYSGRNPGLGGVGIRARKLQVRRTAVMRRRDSKVNHILPSLP